MKYLKRINLKEINQENIKQEIKKEYEKGKKYYEEIEKNKIITNKNPSI